MAKKYAEMTPAEQKEFLREQKKFVSREEMKRRGLIKYGKPGLVERPEFLEKRAFMPPEEPEEDFEEIEVPRYVERKIPVGDWRINPVNGTVCVRRDVEVVQVDPKTKEDIRIVKYDEEEKCVIRPETRRCILTNEPLLKEDSCEVVKLAFACADETAGMLTARQAAGLTDVPHSETKECIGDLHRADLVRTEKGKPRTWAGERYFAMDKKTREKILKEIREES